jgi:hypothetical protein
MGKGVLPAIRSRAVRLIAGVAVASLAATLTASADELPTRKPGLWEIRMLDTATKAAGMTMQQCTDAATDKDLTSNLSPMAKQTCSRNDVRKTAAGYMTDAVCTVNGMSMTSHSDVTGDFNSAYTVQVTSKVSGTPAGGPRETTMTVEAKWLGPCKPDQKPGDIVMPGGFKINITDMQKLKGLLPK